MGLAQSLCELLIICRVPIPCLKQSMSTVKIDIIAVYKCYRI